MQRETRLGPGGPRPGSGRPALPPGRRLSERVMVNLTKGERAALRRLAGEASEGSVLRRLLLAHLRAKARRGPRRRDDR